MVSPVHQVGSQVQQVVGPVQLVVEDIQLAVGQVRLAVVDFLRLVDRVPPEDQPALVLLQLLSWR